MLRMIPLDRLYFNAVSARYIIQPNSPAAITRCLAKELNGRVANNDESTRYTNVLEINVFLQYHLLCGL
jgi:hypothetical protein